MPIIDWTWTGQPRCIRLRSRTHREWFANPKQSCPRLLRSLWGNDPRPGRIAFGYGLALSEESGAQGSNFAVLIGGETIWSSSATQDKGWTDVQLDLAPYADQSIQLSLNHRRHSRLQRFLHPEIVGPKTSDGPRRIIVIGMDTLRADHLGTHGYGRGTSPGLDQIAEQSVVFEEAWTPAPDPTSFRSCTGRWPCGSRCATSGSCRPTVFHWRLRCEHTVGTGLGFADGFDHWSYDNMADGDVQVDRTLAWLTERQHEDAFIFLHMMDPRIFYIA